MATCPYCGQTIEDGKAFCTNCGASLKEFNQAAKAEAPKEPDYFSEPAPTYPQDPAPSYAQEPVPSYSQNNYSRPEPIPTGGLIAWGIFVLLFCTIPGVVALVKIRGINQADTVEEQQRRLADVKKWLIAGTVLAVINLIMQVVSRLSQ